MKIKIQAPPQRNPFAVLAQFRRAGEHRKSNKAMRRKERVQALKRELDTSN